ncbi:hypothetical protein HC024_08260 [Methylococcaceae bacterium WWC4]|nr:hypothetical protein [Methylococcaceae bacterium WWC4]
MSEIGATLKNACENGLTAHQFDVFRRNYVYRTVTTIYTVAVTVAASLLHSPPALGVALRTTYGALLEELGPPNQSRVVNWIHEERRSHVELLFECINAFTANCFPSLELLQRHAPLSMQNILPESVAYRNAQIRLFDPVDFASTVGAAYALEHAAEGMLETIQRAIFVPIAQRSNMNEEAVRDALRYFSVHLNGTEADHGKEAGLNLEEAMSDPTLAERVCIAVERSFELQSSFFSALTRTLLAANSSSSQG